MIEESGGDHWTDRETDAELIVLLGSPAHLPLGRERGPDARDLPEPVHGVRHLSAHDPHSCHTFPAPSC